MSQRTIIAVPGQHGIDSGHLSSGEMRDVAHQLLAQAGTAGGRRSKITTQGARRQWIPRTPKFLTDFEPLQLPRLPFQMDAQSRAGLSMLFDSGILTRLGDHSQAARLGLAYIPTTFAGDYFGTAMTTFAGIRQATAWTTDDEFYAAMALQRLVGQTFDQEAMLTAALFLCESRTIGLFRGAHYDVIKLLSSVWQVTERLEHDQTTGVKRTTTGHVLIVTLSRICQMLRIEVPMAIDVASALKRTLELLGHSFGKDEISHLSAMVDSGLIDQTGGQHALGAHAIPATR
jgi:hypothetical protein